MTDGTAHALVIGESLVDVVRRAGEDAEHPGGSPANVAIGLARLGRQVDLLTWFGADRHGRLVRDHLTAAGVTVVPGSDSAPRTSLAIASLDATGAAEYEFDLTWQVPQHTTARTVEPLVVHTGSIAAVLEPGAQEVARIVTGLRGTTTVTYDPNIRPSLMPPADLTRPVVEAMVGLADVVKVSQEDLEWFGEWTELARRWAAGGPALVVVTHGGAGATAFTSGQEVRVTAPTVQVADTVGAGDSFMAGLVDGLWSAGLLGADRRDDLRGIDDGTLRGVLERCVRIAAITVGRPGADPPWLDELA